MIVIPHNSSPHSRRTANGCEENSVYQNKYFMPFPFTASF